MKTETVKAALEYLIAQGEISRNISYYPLEIATIITFLENEEVIGLNDEETLNKINRPGYCVGDYKPVSYLINPCDDEAG